MGALICATSSCCGRPSASSFLRTLINRFSSVSCSSSCSRRSARRSADRQPAPPDLPPCSYRVWWYLGHVSGVQSIALTMSQEFGFTERSRTGSKLRVRFGSWRCRRFSRVRCRTHRGADRVPDCLGRARRGRGGNISLHWLIILTFVPIACIAMAGLGLSWVRRSNRATSV